MLETWLRPVSQTICDTIEHLYDYQLGKNIGIHRVDMGLPAFDVAQVALIGLDAPTADAVRSHLYALAFPFGKFNVVDLGNVRKYHSETIIPILAELLKAGIV
ncbi:MAG: hypothetical protein RI894_425, partial [Bacteroidota bacterium]